MAIPSTHNLIQLLTFEEYDDLYGLPHFSEEERVLFFALSSHDKKLVDSFQSSIIQILSSHEYHAKTKEALWEYDGILKSLYILNYVDDIKTRQAVRAALNRGESYHQLCRAIACINGGRFRGSTELEMEIWNECTRLVASAIIFYNAYILSALLDKAKGDKQIEIVTQWSPVAWTHLNFLGNYDFHRRQLSLEIHRWLKNINVDSPEFVV